MSEVGVVSREELKKKIDSKAKFLLVETLAPERFGQGHLPGAINLPPDQVKQLAAQVLPEKSAEIIVYCSSPT